MILPRFCKFAIVGGSGILVNTGILYLSHSMLGFSLLPSSIIATETAILSNFVLNDTWTFAENNEGYDFAERKSTLQKLLKFQFVSLVPVCTNILLLLFFANYMFYIYANVLGIAAGFAWNYFVNCKWTWK
jgi:dolichol-phosphate mannosyltransferase